MRKKSIQYNVDGIQYVPVKFVEGVRDYLEYWVYNYDSGKLERQRRYISKKLSKRDREQQVREMSREINGLLHQGFTLGLKQEQDKVLKTLEAFQKANKIKDGENGERANANYRSYLNILTLYLKEKKKDVLPITQFDREEMFLFLDWLNEERNVGPRTRNNYKDYVRTLFNTLIDRGVVQDNPASKIKDLATRSGRYIIFTASQKAHLEVYMKKHNYRLYLYTRFIYYAFMRPIEICRMR
ncbi:MAG: phage integrase SAM-like domain-containing protein, partial [Bacteroidota bacterium]